MNFWLTNPYSYSLQRKYVKNITDLVSPENCLALYFLGYLEKKIYGKVNLETIKNLENRLKIYDYWQERFDQYGLSSDQLKKEKFNFDRINNSEITL